MLNYTSNEVKQAINGLRSKLGRREDIDLQKAFNAGLHPNLLGYGKLGMVSGSMPILEKYLIGATSFVNQPSNYYDIFRACRCVNIVLSLNEALNSLLAKKVGGLDPRLDRLLKEVEHDAFDAIAFEILTAARYAQEPKVAHLQFIDQDPPRKTPDFLVKMNSIEAFVECKKVDRSQNFTILIRNAVRDGLNEVIASFGARGKSVLADVTFNCDPQTVNVSLLVAACHEALEQRTVIIDSNFTVRAVGLAPWKSDTYTLYPSPYLHWHRYGYRVRSEWFGIVQQMVGSCATRADLPRKLKGGTSSWIDKIDWDAAVKWRIGAEDVIAKYRRFAFDGLFKGLDQIKNGGPNSTVHLWLETDYSIGGRQSSLVDLHRRISMKPRDAFGWIIINETLFDISPKGRFDLIENAHFIRGQSATTKEALVYGVFTPKEPDALSSEFGVGTELPDIDED